MGVTEAMTKVVRLALLIVLALGVSAVQAAAVNRTVALSDLGHVGGLGQQLSRSLQPLAADPGLRNTVREYQVRIRNVDKTIARAREFLAQKTLDPGALARIVEEFQTHQIEVLRIHRETVRNERQLMSSQFENANKIIDQYINMMASVMKTMREMSGGVIRNIR
jgi:phage-related protein